MIVLGRVEQTTYLMDPLYLWKIFYLQFLAEGDLCP
jgi:hypothetical protein